MKNDELATLENENLNRLATLFEWTNEYFKQRSAQSINRNLVIRNWLFGCYIVEFEQLGAERAKHGEGLIKGLAKKLKERHFRGGSLSTLKQIRAFYLARREIGQTPSGQLVLDGEKSQTLSGFLENVVSKPENSAILERLSETLTLSWSHYVTLLTIENQDERSFYEIEASQNNWGVRELKRQIDSSLYQRLALSRDRDEVRRLATEGQVVAKAADLIKNPLVLEFLDLEEKASYSERDLETAIIDKLQSFLLELGKGFLFEARQRRFTFDDDHYYVDLVLYNRLLRCYVLLDLKIGKLDHGDLGQMQMYVNYFDRHVKLDDELPTVGIVLCAHNNQAMVELTLPKDANIFASKYQLYLPSKEELKRELEKIEAEIDEFGLEAGE
jgi:predicted nuclease of restriction endonuclease-like (RecB) superfamily